MEMGKEMLRFDRDPVGIRLYSQAPSGIEPSIRSLIGAIFSGIDEN
jgi:hypothetical protein